MEFRVVIAKTLAILIVLPLAGGTITAAHAVPIYLNDELITVEVGSGTTAPFNNLAPEISLANVIDAPSATAAEDHVQATHVWVTGILELIFDLGTEYNLTALHFWNYFAESFDVDNIDFSFADAANAPVGVLSITPALGGGGSNPIFAENYALDFPSNVQFVTATLSGSNGQVDFNNIGFTGEASVPVPVDPADPVDPPDPVDPIDPAGPTPISNPGTLMLLLPGLVLLCRFARWRRTPLETGVAAA